MAWGDADQRRVVGRLASSRASSTRRRRAGGTWELNIVNLGQRRRYNLGFANVGDGQLGGGQPGNLNLGGGNLGGS